jgi:hypothetical protein
MISWALDLADMIWFGLAERAPLKNVRMKLMVGEVGSGDVVEWVVCMKKVTVVLEYYGITAQIPMIRC